MAENLEVTEIEYMELISLGFANYKIGLRIKTTPATYQDDFAELVIEVKKKLQEVKGAGK